MVSMVKTMDVRNSFKEPGRLERSLFSQFLPNIISCRLSEASSLGLLGMVEHYQIRIEASRYFEEDRERVRGK